MAFFLASASAFSVRINRRNVMTDHLTALIVTHDTAQAERIASRAILIDAGRLILNDTVQEVLHAEAVRP